MSPTNVDSIPTPVLPRRVLVLDDNQAIQQLLTHFLNELAITSFCANSIAAAEKLFQQEQPIDLVISDILLDEGEAYGFVDWIRAQQPQLPIIVMSGLVRPNANQEQKSIVYLQKPFFLEDMRTALAEAMRIATR